MSYEVTRQKAPAYKVTPPKKLRISFAFNLSKPWDGLGDTGWQMGDIAIRPADIIRFAGEQGHEFEFERWYELMVDAEVERGPKYPVVTFTGLAVEPRWTDDQEVAWRVLRELAADDHTRLHRLIQSLGLDAQTTIQAVLDDLFSPLDVAEPIDYGPDPWNARYTVTITKAPEDWHPLFSLIRKTLHIDATQAKAWATTAGTVVAKRVKSEVMEELTRSLEEIGVEHRVDVEDIRTIEAEE